MITGATTIAPYTIVMIWVSATCRLPNTFVHDVAADEDVDAGEGDHVPDDRDDAGDGTRVPKVRVMYVTNDPALG